MAIEKYKIDYQVYEAFCILEVDDTKVTMQLCKEFLDFFSWEHPCDDEGDLKHEAIKKIGIQCIKESTFNFHNTKGVISDFENLEGFPKIDGSQGIKLITVEGYDFDPNGFQLELVK